MQKARTFHNCLIVVPSGSYPHLIDGPQELKQLMNGSNMADNCIFDYEKGNDCPTFPTAPGVYLATLEYWFEQGYADGYIADSESDYTFICANARRVLYWDDTQRAVISDMEQFARYYQSLRASCIVTNTTVQHG